MRSSTGFRHRFALVALASLGAGCDDIAIPNGPESDFSVEVMASSAMGGKMPLSGAAVAVDTADGARHEGTTDSNGRVNFSGLDLERAFSFTAAAPGYVAVSVLGLTQPGGWSTTLSPFGQDPTWVDVSGVVRGMQDPTHFAKVSTSIPSTNSEGLGPQYALRVAPNTAFTLVVAETAYAPASASAAGRAALFLGWAKFSQPPLTDVTKLDLALPDATGSGGLLGESLMPSNAQGTLNVPMGMAGATGEIFVSNQASSGSMVLGGPTRLTRNANGNVDYEVQWVSPVLDLVTTYGLRLSGAYSYVRTTVPPGGAVSFLAPPSMTSPVSMSDAIVITDLGPSASVILSIRRDNAATGWRVYVEGQLSAVTTLQIPKLPSSVDPRLVLGTGEVTLTPEVCMAGSDGFCASYAVGAPAVVKP